MKLKFVKKRVISRSFPLAQPNKVEEAVNETEQKVNVEAEVKSSEKTTEKKSQKAKNKANKKQEIMTENEKLEMAQELIQDLKPETKVIKKDKGLIERTESSKIILTEDNKQILND